MTALNAYAVSLVFGTGPIILNTMVAPSAEAATAMLMHQVMQNPPPGGGTESLTGVAVIPLSAEWLRYALRALETGDAPASVVRLVQPAQQGLADQAQSGPPSQAAFDPARSEEHIRQQQALAAAGNRAAWCPVHSKYDFCGEPS